MGETLPQADWEHAAVHVPPLFDESFTMLAVKFTVWPKSTLRGVDGETLTEIGGGGGALAAPHPERQTAIARTISVAMADARCFDFMTASSTP